MLPYIDQKRGVAVGSGEGLLVVEYEGTGQAPKLRVAEHDLGVPPTAAALAAGRHELVIRQGDRTSFRYFLVRSGETRIVTLSAADL